MHVLYTHHRGTCTFNLVPRLLLWIYSLEHWKAENKSGDKAIIIIIWAHSIHLHKYIVLLYVNIPGTHTCTIAKNLYEALHKLTLPLTLYTVLYVIYWRDFKLSAVVLGVCLMTLLTLSLNTFIHTLVLIQLSFLVVTLTYIVTKIAIDSFYNRDIANPFKLVVVIDTHHNKDTFLHLNNK